MLTKCQYNSVEFDIPQICPLVCTKKSGKHILFIYNNLSITGQLGL